MREGLGVGVGAAACLGVGDGEGGARTERCQGEGVEEVTAERPTSRQLRRGVAGRLPSHGITVTPASRC